MDHIGEQVNQGGSSGGKSRFDRFKRKSKRDQKIPTAHDYNYSHTNLGRPNLKGRSKSADPRDKQKKIFGRRKKSDNVQSDWKSSNAVGYQMRPAEINYAL